MDNLKIKFKLHGLEFELEGAEATVKKEFEQFKSFTLEILSKVNIVTSQVTTTAPGLSPKVILPTQDTTALDSNEYPVMKEIVKRDLPKAETDWILVYAFYASRYGENTFTEEEIKKYYESTSRKNVSRMANLSNNIKSILNKGYIKVHNDEEYLIKSQGIAYVQQILQGNSTAKISNRPSPKANNLPTPKASVKKETETKKTKGANTIAFIDLSLPAEEINALTTFYQSRNPKTQNEEVAVVMKWYKDHIKSKEISLEEINYLLNICSKTPSAIEQVLINMKGSKFRWISNAGEAKVQLTSIGENHVLNKLPKVSK